MTGTQPLAYTMRDAARALGVGKTTLYGLIGTGQIEARKIGAKTLIPAPSLQAYLASLPPAHIRTGRRAV
jgi:excisionase family DNA binding protein